jgi:Zinc-binding loop region of homing endonuclease
MAYAKTLDEALRRDEERFWSYVDKSKRPDGCWIWTGARNKKTGRGNHSVGRFNGEPVRHGKTIEQAHVYAWALMHGCKPIGHGLERGSSGTILAHKCHNGHLGCVNPNHLFVTTQCKNQKDKYEAGTHLAIQIQRDRALIRTIKKEVGLNEKDSFAKVAEKIGMSESDLVFAVCNVYEKWILENFGVRARMCLDSLAIKSKKVT